MGDVVNLRLARKRKARVERDRSADENRLLHGRTKADRDAAEATAARTHRQHEAHRRDRQRDGGEDKAGRS